MDTENLVTGRATDSVRVRKDGLPRHRINSDANDGRRDRVGQEGSSGTGKTGGGAGSRVVFVGLEILEMSGIQDGAHGKRTVEIRFVGAAQRQTTNEHGPGVARIEVVGLFCRYSDDVGGAGSTDNVN